jgi:hypothetical protein
MRSAWSSRFAGVRRAVFARHANLRSAWSRWATVPLVLVPVWTRRRTYAVQVVVWFATNPVLFPQPVDERAWSTRAMLGEEFWLVDRPRDLGLGVNVAASVIGVVAMIAAYRRRPVPMVVATAAQMALLLAYWELMVRYLERSRATGAVVPGSAR